jgi:hypothetical protein
VPAALAQFYGTNGLRLEKERRFQGISFVVTKNNIFELMEFKELLNWAVILKICVRVLGLWIG